MIPKTPRLAIALTLVLPANKSVLDVECGYGERLKRLHTEKFRVGGIDSRTFDNEESKKIEFKGIKKCAPTKIPKEAPVGSVLCFNLLDRIKEKDQAVIIDGLIRKCDSKLVISWSKDGVNGKNSHYVISLFEKQGFILDMPTTEHLRTIGGRDIKSLSRSIFAFNRTVKKKDDQPIKGVSGGVKAN